MLLQAHTAEWDLTADKLLYLLNKKIENEDIYMDAKRQRVKDIEAQLM